MRYLLTFLMLMGIAYGQSTYHMRYDSVKIGKGTGGPGELIVESSTKDSTSGVLVNIGGGKTQFKKIRAISATQFVVGSDTITITGSGGGGGGSGTVTQVTASDGTGIDFTITNGTSTPNISLSLTSSAVGLSNVDNTSDLLKPLSTATITALALKQDNITLTTTGTSGAASLIGSTLNIPQYVGVVTSVQGLTGAVTVTDANLSTSDITTNNTSTAKHGFAPKLSNVATEYLNGQGAWSTPTASVAWGAITGTLSSQTDLNTALGLKANLAGPTFTGTVILPSTTSIGTVTDTELGYVDGVTSSIQTQLNTKVTATDVKNYPRSPAFKLAEALGSTVLYETLGKSRVDIGTTVALADGVSRMQAIYVNETTTISGVKWYQAVQGNYTADNYNGIFVCSYSSGTLTVVLSSTDDGNIWKATANSVATKSFSSSASLSPGVYYIFFIYNSSAQTTAPTVGVYTAVPNGGASTSDFTNSAKLMGTISLSALPGAPFAISTVTAATSGAWAGFN